MTKFNEKPKVDDTPSQALIKTMEAFSEAEPQNVLILWEDKEYINFVRNGMSKLTAIGILDYAKARLLQSLLEDK